MSDNVGDEIKRLFGKECGELYQRGSFMRLRVLMADKIDGLEMLINQDNDGIDEIADVADEDVREQDRADLRERKELQAKIREAIR